MHSVLLILYVTLKLLNKILQWFKHFCCHYRRQLHSSLWATKTALLWDCREEIFRKTPARLQLSPGMRPDWLWYWVQGIKFCDVCCGEISLQRRRLIVNVSGTRSSTEICGTISRNGRRIWRSASRSQKHMHSNAESITRKLIYSRSSEGFSVMFANAVNSWRHWLFAFRFISGLLGFVVYWNRLSLHLPAVLEEVSKETQHQSTIYESSIDCF